MYHIKSAGPARSMENSISLHSPYYPPNVQPNGSFLVFLHNPRILSFILPYLEWTDFYSLSNSCRHSRLLFEDLGARDVILSRFVPWYAHAIRLRDPSNGYKDVPISLTDLDLLLTSQRLPLHQYPLYARRVLTSSHSAADIVSRLESLTHAHSRFVLLLQAYVHSSNGMLQPEPEDVVWPWPEPSGQLRRLTFPAPLLYCPHESPQLPGSGKRKSSKNSRNVRMTSRGSHRPDESARSTSAALPSKRRRSLPFFGCTSSGSFASDTKSWRRPSTLSRISTETDCMLRADWLVPKHRSTDSFLFSGSGSGSSPLSASRNSLRPSTSPSSSSGSISRSISTASRPFGIHPRPLMRHSFASGYASHPVKMTSPLDLSFAVSRVRAPILRVFVPFSDHQDASQELLSCEQQLIDAGLWDHLSAGDLVYNLGYVPPIEGDEVDTPVSSSDADLKTSQLRHGLSRRSDNRQKRQSHHFANYHGRSTHSRKWLLYNGQFLVPYKPPETISLPDPLSLPTPFYYMHIMPPYTNPVYVIDGLGLGDINAVQLDMHLVHTTIKVRSPHSPTGRALVRKYAWVARILRPPAFCDCTTGQELRYIGDRWVGEWILEGDGTKEGKEILFDCVLGRIAGPTEWEVVVERCDGGRTWLRLLRILSRTTDMQPRTSIQNL